MLVFKLNIFFYLSLLLIIVESIEKPSFNDEMPGVLSNTNYSECIIKINVSNFCKIYSFSRLFLTKVHCITENMKNGFYMQTAR